MISKIGLGAMGAVLVQNIADRGFGGAVFNRTRGVAQVDRRGVFYRPWAGASRG